MAISEITTGLKLAVAAINLLKTLKDLIPASEKKKEAEEILNEAEKNLKIAEAKVAEGLGFQICKSCWPPEVMLEDESGTWKCRKCGRIEDKWTPVRGD